MSTLSLFGQLLLLFTSILPNACGQYMEPRLCDGSCYCSRAETVVDCGPQDRILGVPVNLPPETRKLVIQGGAFPAPGHLGVLNLTGLSQLVSLRIVNSQLRSIEARAFRGMTNLRDLDLSLNLLYRIEPHTFYGLHLQTLYLQEQRLLPDHYNLYDPSTDPEPMTITDEAFYGLSAVRIDLRGNSFSDISFSLFSKVDKLEKLILSNNRIRKLDPKFADYFDNSHRVLDLTDNPLMCSCKLAWLVQREKEWIGQAPTLKTTCIVDPLIGGPGSRVELKKLSMNHLCMSSRIQSIGIDIAPTGKAATLSCTAVAFNHLDSKGPYASFHYDAEPYINHPVVRNRPPSVAWKYVESGQLRQVTGMPSDLHQNFDRSVVSAEDVSTTRTVQLNVSLSQSNRKFNCITWDEKEKDQEVLVNIRGPVIPPVVEPKETLALPNSENPAQLVPNLKDSDTMSASNIAYVQSNFLFQKQYTLLEMIGAVIGTFLVTLVVLLVGSRCLLLLKHRAISQHLSKQVGSRELAYDRKQPDKYGRGRNGNALANGGSSNEGVHSMSCDGISTYPMYHPFLTSTSGVTYPNHIPPATSLIANPTTGHLMPLSAATPLLQPTMTVQGLQAMQALSQWPAPPGSSYSVTGSLEYDIPRAMELSQVASEQATLHREQQHHQQQQQQQQYQQQIEAQLQQPTMTPIEAFNGNSAD